MILATTIIISLGIFIAILSITIRESVEVVNAFRDLSANSIITLLKSLRNISAIFGVLVVGGSLYGLNASATTEETIRSKTLLSYGIVIIFITVITSFIVSIF